MLRSLLALTLSCAFVPVAMADTPPTDTPYQFALFNGPAAGACLQTPSNLSLENDRVHQAQCELAGDNQMYVFETAVLGYRLRTAQSALCFDAPTGSTPGDTVRLSPCEPSANQQWDVSYTPSSPAIAMIRNAQTGLCLDLANGYATQSTCSITNGSGPSWVMNLQISRLPGTASALRSTLTDRCLTVDGVPSEATCTNDGRTSLRILPVDNAGNTFRFMGAAEHTCLLNVDGVLTYDACITGPSAHWRLLEHSMGVLPSGEKAATWQVQSGADGMCLNVQRGGVTPDELSLWPCDSVANSHWRFTRH